MKLIGKAHKFGDDVNTDYIISGKYKFKTLDEKEMAKHVMEGLDPEFYKKISPGDFIVAGRNFGCGSSREQAPIAIKAAGISAVIAKSFARIFFRNSINIGLPAIECKEIEKINNNDELDVNMENGKIINKTKNVELKIIPLPKIMIKILNDGGLAAHFRKYGGFKFD